MTAIAKLFVGAAIVCALGLAAQFVDPLPGSKAAAVEKLSALAEERLGEDRAWAQTRLDGQTITMTGDAESEAELDRLKAEFGRGDGPAGPFTRVRYAVEILPPIADPHIWVAERYAGAVILSGNAPNEAALAAIEADMRDLFRDDEITSGVQVARGAAGGENWRAAAGLALRALTRLEDGAVTIENAVITISGTLRDAADAGAVLDLLASPPPGFRVIDDIRAPGRTPGPAGDAGAPPAATIPDPAEPQRRQACIADVRTLIAGNAVQFELGANDLAPASHGFLDELSDLLTTCGGIRLEIIGHTDSIGRASRNRRLSLLRADAVADYLGAKGIARDRLATRGAGENEPVASNQTADGRAANRRIQFAISDGP
ncbi:MAG: OmpA family protein [Pseudomonadota bacterium]